MRHPAWCAECKDRRAAVAAWCLRCAPGIADRYERAADHVMELIAAFAAEGIATADLLHEANELRWRAAVLREAIGVRALAVGAQE